MALAPVEPDFPEARRGAIHNGIYNKSYLLLLAFLDEKPSGRYRN